MTRPAKKNSIGILGGTFDPVHKGHLTVARTARDRFQLDGILFIPAFSPPHKDRRLTSFSHRVAMLEAALEGEKRMSVSIIESERNAPSYTVETLKELHQRLDSTGFCLIIGADMFTEIELWYRYRELFKLADIIIAARPGISSARVAEQVALLPGRFSYDPQRQMWCRDDGFRIFYCPDVSVAVSSSEIRERLAKGLSVAEFVPQPVRDYIQHHKLYAPSDNDGH